MGAIKYAILSLLLLTKTNPKPRNTMNYYTYGRGIYTKELTPHEVKFERRNGYPGAEFLFATSRKANAEARKLKDFSDDDLALLDSLGR